MSDAARIISVPGGYGIFGGRIAEAMARDPRCRVRIVGRNATIGRNLAHRIGAEFRAADCGDRESLRRAIEGSFLVVHAAGPFQGADYRVAELCLELGAHYIDVADAREFVAGIGRLDEEAPARADRRLGGQLDARDHLGDDPRGRARVRPHRADPDGAEPGQSEPQGRLDHRRRPELPGPDDPGLAGRALG